eukprot:TRINITY_DN2932_c0_g1_i2.p1 TRINITY_DN2932_c0_g1~~TRINITY_DN2932_c0_g1_i2.p1  ORF type:complete len:210 (-),score=18.63 TRINITY_DN2932_c0_g1_i2:35-664(-)
MNKPLSYLLHTLLFVFLVGISFSVKHQPHFVEIVNYINETSDEYYQIQIQRTGCNVNFLGDGQNITYDCQPGKIVIGSQCGPNCEECKSTISAPYGRTLTFSYNCTNILPIIPNDQLIEISYGCNDTNCNVNSTIYFGSFPPIYCTNNMKYYCKKGYAMYDSCSDNQCTQNCKSYYLPMSCILENNYAATNLCGLNYTVPFPDRNITNS